MTTPSARIQVDEEKLAAEMATALQPLVRRIAAEVIECAAKAVADATPKPPAFKPGDRVVLKSGGPIMAVTHHLQGDGCCACTWFGGNLLLTGCFQLGLLRLATHQDDWEARQRS